MKLTTQELRIIRSALMSSLQQVARTGEYELLQRVNKEIADREYFMQQAEEWCPKEYKPRRNKDEN